MDIPTQLSFVSLQVSDFEASRSFYANLLGFRPAPQSPPDACIFTPQNGALFAIRKPLVDLTATSQLGWGVGLWFGVADLAALLQRLAGEATLVRGIQPGPFGHPAIIADPDGYWLTLQETQGA